jgi:hypothetical protein
MVTMGIEPATTVSAGGSCRLLPAADRRWVAMNLARRDDLDLLAAWMRRPWDGPVWDAVAGALHDQPAEAAVERAQLLGIPAAIAVPPAAPRRASTRLAGPARRTPSLVVDLSTLWAGPLCARLVGDATGLRVVKVEDPQRPDGARAGPPAFWHRLNATKDHTAVEFTTEAGRRDLAALLDDADVVITSARPRALDALGLHPTEHAARGAVWVTITGYGLTGPWRNRVAFGDDAAVAGGAAVAAGSADHPAFVLDAVADPLSGLCGAAATLDALAIRRGALIDVSLRDVVADALTAGQYAAHTDQEVA